MVGIRVIDSPGTEHRILDGWGFASIPMMESGADGMNEISGDWWFFN